MIRWSLFFTFSLLSTSFYADDFTKLNPTMTKKMQTNQHNATLCSHPALAQESFDDTFRYGCFCGKNYPALEHPSKKPYQLLDLQERGELIALYYQIKPYDSIDEACMKHDICYIYKGKEAQACNDALQKSLEKIENYFSKLPAAQKRDSTPRRCETLASDMGAAFRTIFTTGDDISASRFGMFALSTPITMASKTLQQTARAFQDGSNYPLMHEKCIVKSTPPPF